MAQYHSDDRTVIAVTNSDFYRYLQCDSDSGRDGGGSDCSGTVEQFIHVFFGGMFNKDNELRDILVLALFLVAARVMTFYALQKFNFSNT